MMMARYRIGDGDGVAVVGLAHSCVQDSSQALYSAIWNFETMTRKDPSFVQWVKENPGHADVHAYKKLAGLSSSLDGLLRPLGIARSDWRAFAEDGTFSAIPASPW